MRVAPGSGHAEIASVVRPTEGQPTMSDLTQPLHFQAFGRCGGGGSERNAHYKSPDPLAGNEVIRDHVVRTTNPNTSIAHYEVFAKEYDRLSKKHEWHSPDILFGLAFEFIKKNQRLLDLGIGTGQSSAAFKKTGLKVHGIDGSKEMLKICRGKHIADELTHQDLRELPLNYPPKHFDHVISNGVFYFFEDLQPLFSETKRLLKDNGTFSFTVEAGNEGGTQSYVNKDNDAVSERIKEKVGVRLYRHGEDYISSLIKRFGFQILKKVEYFAYHSPTEGKDIYFKVYVLKSM